MSTYLLETCTMTEMTRLSSVMTLDIAGVMRPFSITRSWANPRFGLFILDVTMPSLVHIKYTVKIIHPLLQQDCETIRL